MQAPRVDLGYVIEEPRNLSAMVQAVEGWFMC